MYPSFEHCEPSRFPAWHRRYTGRIGCIVAPLMIAQLGLAGAMVLTAPTPAFLVYAALVGATWIVTFFVSVPLHRALETRGFHRPSIRRLISTNWIRVALWSTIAAQRLWLS